jgi:hypothetical protein
MTARGHGRLTDNGNPKTELRKPPLTATTRASR